MKNPVLTKRYEQEAAVTRYRIVTPGTDDDQVKHSSSPNEPLIGVADDANLSQTELSAAGESVDIIVLGIAEVEAGGTIAAGDPVTSDANGKAVKATAGQNTIGIAKVSAVSGDIFEVYVLPNVVRDLGKVGTSATGVTAAEYGDEHSHVTVLTVDTTLPAIAGGAALAVGKLLYTLPAGACIVKSAHMNLALQQSEGNVTADTPDGGLGTTIGSGANALLSAVGAAAENILTGQTFNDCDGTAEEKTVADQILVIESGDDHTVYFNVADTWAAGGDAALGVSGTVVLEWTYLD